MLLQEEQLFISIERKNAAFIVWAVRMPESAAVSPAAVIIQQKTNKKEPFGDCPVMSHLGTVPFGSFLFRVVGGIHECPEKRADEGALNVVKKCSCSASAPTIL